jgi:eukaryotic-like serine/threonine-protein kinase
MTSERWRQISAAFQRAVTLDHAARNTWLDEVCEGDLELRAEVEDMLAAYIEGEAPFAAASAATTLSMLPTHTTTIVAGKKARRLPFLLATAAIGVVTTALFVYGAWLLVRYGGQSIATGWDEGFTGGRFVVSRIDPEGPARDLLQPGDRIVAWNGVPPLPGLGTGPHRGLLASGGQYALTIERPDGQHTLGLEVIPGPSMLAVRVTYFFTSLVWCAIGLWIGLARPELPVARLAAASSLSVGIVFLGIGVLRAGGLWAPLHVVVGYHFFCRFPSGEPTRGLWRWTLMLLYAAGLVFAVPYLWMTAVLKTQGVAEAARYAWAVEATGPLGLLVFVGAVVGMVSAVPYNYRRLVSEDQRRRVRWVVYCSLGALAAEVWYSMVALYQAFIGPAPVSEMTLLANTAPVVIPVAVAYAVVKHRVIDIRVAVRLGVRYLLARRALQALLLLPVAALVYGVVSNRHLTITELVTGSTGYLYAIAGSGLALRFRRPIRLWLDRRFFRDEYDREHALAALAGDVNRVDSIGDVTRLMRDRLDMALHPKGICVWYRDAREGAEATSSNPELAPADFPSQGPWTTWLEAHAVPAELPLPAAAGVASRQARWFAARQIHLAIPICDGAGHLAGILLLGEKRSEEPYNGNDRRLLGAVAAQVAIARENLRLRARVSEEHRIRHDVLARLDTRLPGLMKECPVCGTCFDGAVEVCANDGAPLTLALPVARVIEGKYRLDRLIGKGGMGAVYEARDMRLERTVAVKIMMGRSFGQQAALRRFHREARAAARLNHPNIVRVYDYGRLEGEGAYLVMERVYAGTLRARLNETGRLTPSETADWFDAILQGLAAAHAEGIVHRDLKPENIVGPGAAGADRNVKILDFGLAKVADAARVSGTVTIEGTVMGTLGYMAPEQLVGGDVTYAADLFAVGVMVVEALIGERPFRGDTHADVSRAVMHDVYHLPPAGPDVAVVDAMLQQCLAKDAASRPQSAAVLRLALIPALRDLRG